MAAANLTGAATTAARADEDVVVERLVRHERRLGRRDVVLGAVTPIVLIGLWQIVASAGLIDTRVFTPPVDIVSAAGDLVSSGRLQSDVGITVMRLLIGYFAGAIVGIAAGLLMGYFRIVRAALSPTFMAFYAVPKIAILPLLLVIFGLGETPRILIVAITTFFLMQIGVMDGVRNLDPRLLEAGRAFGAKGSKLFVHVVLPASLPAVFTALRLSAGIGLIVITATEFVASDKGLGYLIWNSWTLYLPEQMYVGLVCTAALGALFAGIVAQCERLAIPWQRRTRTRRRPRRSPR
jgi:ABC-type nitrate/sulfonate/bicarbonate transport system permease component